MRTEEAVTDAEGMPFVAARARGRLPLADLGGRLAAAAPRRTPAGDRGRRRPGSGRLMLAELAMALVVAGMTAYAVLGGADFGAGFWDLTAGGAERGGRVRGMVQRSMGPVWEANHVWLIFVLVILWTALPGRVRLDHVDALRAAVPRRRLGIIFRGTAFALRGRGGDDRRGARAGSAVRALVGPRAVLPGRLRRRDRGRARSRSGTRAGDPFSSWLNPLGITVGVALRPDRRLPRRGLHGRRLGARSGCADLQRAFRARALGAGIAAGLVVAAGPRSCCAPTRASSTTA